jgi:hypothetical protein
MSGGSLDYVYFKVDEAAHSIRSRSRNPLHHAFAKHLVKVSKALHDLEWVYSGDCCEPSEEKAIREVLHPSDEIESAKEEAEIALQNLERAIKNASVMTGEGKK